MAQLMKTVEAPPPELRWKMGKMLPVKREAELENSSDEEHFPLINKRSKLSPSLQQQLTVGSGGFLVSPSQQLTVGSGGFLVSPSQQNSLDEPSPLGLRLRKSPSLLDLIQMRLSQGNTPKVGSHGKKEQKGSIGVAEKLKASNFPASVLRIGSWEYKSRHEGDLVAKCYFAKHKIVWEVLDGGLKNKIEIQWSDIMGLKANYPDEEPGTMDVVLARQPLFFRETNPQPRKHTLWQATSDFTEGQASIHRRHYLQCPPGLLGKHFEKLVQCDARLNFLSHQAEITLDSPYFESRVSVFEDPCVPDSEFDLNNEESASTLNLQTATSPSGAHSSSSKSEQDPVSRPFEHILQEKPSSSLGASEDICSREVEQRKGLNNLNQLRVPGVHPSVSMSDLVSHLEQCVSEQETSKAINLACEKRKRLEILDEISRSLLSDTQHMPASDEKSLMSRVNSLYCLLQKDPATALKSEPHGDVATGEKRFHELNLMPALPFGRKADEDPYTSDDESDDLSDCKPSPTISRKDSAGDLLLNLPRIASLPQFLFNTYEDSGNQAR